MQEKTVIVGGKEVRFRSSAAIPRLYRIRFKRDIFKDLSKLESAYKGKNEDGAEMQIEDLEIFENVAYQITDESYYYSFNLSYSGSTVTLAYKGRNSSGQIIAVYGVN